MGEDLTLCSGLNGNTIFNDLADVKYSHFSSRLQVHLDPSNMLYRRINKASNQ